MSKAELVGMIMELRHSQDRTLRAMLMKQRRESLSCIYAELLFETYKEPARHTRKAYRAGSTHARASCTLSRGAPMESRKKTWANE